MPANPLSPTVYLIRNAGKTVPLTGVIVLAVLLISGIISLINSIPLSINTIYHYSQYMVAVTPRSDPEQVPSLFRKLEERAPVPLERLFLFRGSPANVQSIVGKWQFVVFGLKPDDLRYMLQRYRTTHMDGRLPTPGKPEAIISEPVARNKGLKIGDDLLSPETPENYSPLPVKIVGIAHSPEWFMFNDYGYQDEYHFPKVDAIMACAKTLEDQGKLDRWAYETMKGERAQVFAHFRLEEETRDMFKTLFLILNVVIGTLVLVITIMMGMLMNIYQSQRLVEFGLLQAIGYTKRQLVGRVVAESVLVVLLGWGLGLGVAYGLLELTKRIMMDPRAFALSTWDPMAIQYTIPVPIAILIVATLTIWARFRRFDPVAVVERRLV
jgi:ABC-type lipoprotein release transport system permease subunit